ncbi:unnamed protein product [Effrenium voratum]|nr:unnamed protein product [Effrenium voratum]
MARAGWADDAYVPPYLRPPAGKTIMNRSPSDPQGLLRTTCGLSMHSFMSNSAMRVPGTRPLEELRRDHVEGYRGFVPGVKSETVYGARSTVINNMASDIRPLDFQLTQEEAYHWNRPPDKPQKLRSFADCETWRTWQQDPKYNWMGGEQTRTAGPGGPCYTGHRNFRASHPKLQADAPERMQLGERHSLTRHLGDRDCHPVDQIRPLMPGYRGFLPGRKLQA